MLDRGKLVVLSIFAVAIVAASFAWWWNYNRGRQALGFYGPEAAFLIRRAPRAELLVLAPPAAEDSGPAAEAVPMPDGTHLQIVRRIDISQAKGLIHARASLLSDASYRWNAAGDCQPRIDYAVRFAGPTTATLAFDFDCQRLWHVETGRGATLIPKVAEGWESFLVRQAPATAPSQQRGR